MIDWVLANHREIVRFSRWLVVACGAALFGIASLPHTTFNRLLAIAGLAAIGLVVVVWLSVVLVTILHPRLFAEIRQRRSR